MMVTGLRRIPAAAVLGTAMMMGVAGCSRDEAAPATTPADAASQAASRDTAAAPTQEPAPQLADVIEHSPKALIGISYAPGLDRYPGLARELLAYASQARGDLQEALDGLGNDTPSMPYELSLAFETLLETQDLVVVRAEGSRYTGGAHGQPLVARFVWLPGSGQMLTAQRLVPAASGWETISGYVVDQLRERVATRLSAEDMEPSQLQESLRSATRMIAEGAGPEAENFSQFEPVTDAAGHITALRFVFPPYQVGPYADGTQTADVPAAVLLPVVASEYAGLFAKG